MPIQLAKGSRSTPGSGSRLRLPGPNSTFVREGEYWTITYGGSVIRLRDSKGLRGIAFLLTNPGQPVAAADLLTRADIHASTTDPERVRLAVTKRIKSAIAKIAQHHAALGYHLSTAIKTGHVCTYMPPPNEPMAWTV